MIVLAKNLSLTPSAESMLNSNNPWIGYDNLVTASNVAASSADEDFPVTNLANDSSYLKWKAEIVDPIVEQVLTFTLNTEQEFDYIGFCGHNFGSSQSAVKIEAEYESGVWTELTQFIPADDRPVIVRFQKKSGLSVRATISAGSETAECAVVYIGTLLILTGRIYVGHSPITYARSTRVTNAKSENGEFLGRTVTSISYSSGFSAKNLVPLWVRRYLDPFLKVAGETPFFFAWRPGDYPFETAYCWLTNDPIPKNDKNNGMMSCDFQFGAKAR